MEFLPQRVLSFLILFALLISSTYAEQVKDFIIEADKLSYSEDGSVIEAQGNITATHKDLTIKTQNLTYYIDQGKVNASSGFKMDIKNGVSLVGESLDYDLKEKVGDAKNVRLNLQKTNIEGEKVKLAMEEIDLDSAFFTGCSSEAPHYHISASRLIIYPEEGWLICYFGYFWFYGLPIVPVPAYVFDLSSYGLGKRARYQNMAPIPEFGSNELDGSYVNARFAWFLNKKMNGKVLVSYAEKNGWGGGLEGNYIFNESNDGDFRIYSDPKNNAYGGITHVYSFGPKLGNGEKHFFGLFNIKEQLLFEFITNFSYRERINYQRVTVLPDLTLKLNDVPIFIDRLKANGSLTYGVVSEESTIRTGRGIEALALKYDIPTDIGLFGVGMGQNHSWYEGYGTWTRVTQVLSYMKTWGDIDGNFEHLHYLFYDGASPFNYENYNLIHSDEIRMALGYNFSVHRIGIDFTHYVPTLQPKELDYIMTIGFHCYNIELKYRAMRKEFLFGFSLVSR